LDWSLFFFQQVLPFGIHLEICLEVEMSSAKRYTPNHPTSMQSTTAFGFKKRTWLLYLFLIPLFLAIVLALIKIDIKAFILNLIAFGLFFASAKLSSLGLDNEQIYHSSNLTKAPKVPYKLIASGVLGTATLFSASVAGGASILEGLFLGILATTGYVIYYGIDPRADKLSNVDNISADFAIETLNEAKAKLQKIKTATTQVKDFELHKQLQSTILRAQDIIKKLENEPKDIRVARKFLITYMDGIDNVVNSYTKMDEKIITNETKQQLQHLLNDVEKSFESELYKLKKDGQFDLDVHIDVLREHVNSDLKK